MNFETAMEIENAVANYMNYRINIIVPNISWGLFLHECDLLVLTPTGYAYEIEIKTSKSDLAADLKKRHGHGSEKIRKLYFAIPDKLFPHIKLIPEKAGIITVTQSGCCVKKREAKTNEFASKFTLDEKIKLIHLGLMRTWKLRKKILSLQSPVPRKEG